MKSLKYRVVFLVLGVFINSLFAPGDFVEFDPSSGGELHTDGPLRVQDSSREPDEFDGNRNEGDGFGGTRGSSQTGGQQRTTLSTNRTSPEQHSGASLPMDIENPIQQKPSSDQIRADVNAIDQRQSVVTLPDDFDPVQEGQSVEYASRKLQELAEVLKQPVTYIESGRLRNELLQNIDLFPTDIQAPLKNVLEALDSLETAQKKPGFKKVGTVSKNIVLGLKEAVSNISEVQVSDASLTKAQQELIEKMNGIISGLKISKQKGVGFSSGDTTYQNLPSRSNNNSITSTSSDDQQRIDGILQMLNVDPLPKNLAEFSVGDLADMYQTIGGAVARVNSVTFGENGQAFIENRVSDVNKKAVNKVKIDMTVQDQQVVSQQLSSERATIKKFLLAKIESDSKNIATLLQTPEGIGDLQSEVLFLGKIGKTFDNLEDERKFNQLRRNMESALQSHFLRPFSNSTGQFSGFARNSVKDINKIVNDSKVSLTEKITKILNLEISNYVTVSGLKDPMRYEQFLVEQSIQALKSLGQQQGIEANDKTFVDQMISDYESFQSLSDKAYDMQKNPQNYSLDAVTRNLIALKRLVNKIAKRKVGSNQNFIDMKTIFTDSLAQKVKFTEEGLKTHLLAFKKSNWWERLSVWRKTEEISFIDALKKGSYYNFEKSSQFFNNDVQNDVQNEKDAKNFAQFVKQAITQSALVDQAKAVGLVSFVKATPDQLRAAYQQIQIVQKQIQELQDTNTPAAKIMLDVAQKVLPPGKDWNYLETLRKQMKPLMDIASVVSEQSGVSS